MAELAEYSSLLRILVGRVVERFGHGVNKQALILDGVPLQETGFTLLGADNTFRRDRRSL
jgi:hypothetical protein